MSTKNGQLLVSRQQITLAPGANVIDTGLRQVNHSFGSSSVGEPDLAERTMVVPLPGSASATGNWGQVTLTAGPSIGPDGTVILTLTWAGSEGTGKYNVLFWAPHTSIGPVDAAPYIAPLT